MTKIEDLDLLRTVIDILTKDQFGYSIPKEEIEKDKLIEAQRQYINCLLSLLANGGEADV